MGLDALSKEDLISIGDLAKHFSISKRTLRLYDEMRLFVPAYTNPQTGYRYYCKSQLPRLKMILHLKSVDLSLKQIKEMLESESLSLLASILGSRLDELEEETRTNKAIKTSLIKTMESIKYMQNQVVIGKTFLEYIPQRKIYCYDCTPYDLRKHYTSSPWETILDEVGAIFEENHISKSLFSQWGG